MEATIRWLIKSRTCSLTPKIHKSVSFQVMKETKMVL